MTTPRIHRSHRSVRERHLYLVPPLSEDESETSEPKYEKPRPTYPWDIPTPYVHTLPPTPPTPDWSDHPARRRVVWDRPTDTEDN